ncbi:hypothetical protein DKX38_011494 [Salix brachista]|uniref:Uncharacterized protein n=1 Tax=Salix brachista TaxID=2182728 RepID=A0A5N5LZH8_9ROSI|nr:hypothetical protein DKX38_011494 [Salix brachista]
MAEEGKRVGGLSSGLAVLLNGQDRKENSLKTRLVSSFDDFGNQPMRRAFEYIFGLSNKSLGPFTGPVDTILVCSILKNEYPKFCVKSGHLVDNRYGIHINKDGCESQVVGLEELSICGDIRIKHPLYVESLAMFSSARSNACVWKGKWMYEVLLETSGVMQMIHMHLMGKGLGSGTSYGQPWVVSDVIGYCINPDDDEILFIEMVYPLGWPFMVPRSGVPSPYNTSFHKSFGYAVIPMLIKVVRCARYRISLFSWWKQRGMYATCMLTVQLLLVLSRVDSLFIYIHEFILKPWFCLGSRVASLWNSVHLFGTHHSLANILTSLPEVELPHVLFHDIVLLPLRVDCFHVLRKSDPSFVPPGIFMKQGLASFVSLAYYSFYCRLEVTFVVSHFNDMRSLRRHRHSPEKVNRGMILAPLVGISSNLLDARVGMECGQQNDVAGVFASMDCPDAVHCGFQYLLEYNWVRFSRLVEWGLERNNSRGVDEEFCRGNSRALLCKYEM